MMFLTDDAGDEVVERNAPNVHEIRQSYGTRVALSSGDHFWVEADRQGVLNVLNRWVPGAPFNFVGIGVRTVNPAQIAQLTYGPIPSTEPFETLEN